MNEMFEILNSMLDDLEEGESLSITKMKRKFKIKQIKILRGRDDLKCVI